VNAVPVISTEAYAHVGRYAGAIVLAVFEQIGGVQRMTTWADSAPDNFYTKIFAKMIGKSVQVEHSGSVTLDDAITRLESQSDPVDAEFEEVYDL
jgi:hypothetical protein